jgi:hypothetical protein
VVREAKKAEDGAVVVELARKWNIRTANGGSVTPDTINGWVNEFEERGDDELVKCRQLKIDLYKMSRAEAEQKVNKLLEILPNDPLAPSHHGELSQT